MPPPSELTVMPPPAPLTVGSGKPETPWTRMQAENLSNVAVVLEPAYKLHACLP